MRLLTVLLVAALCATTSGAKVADLVGGEFSAKALPDLADPVQYRRLWCSACTGVARDVYEGLTALSKLRHSRVREFEYYEFFDGLCDRLAKDYGMNTIGNTYEWKDEERLPTAGYWVTSFFQNVCSEVLDKHEQAFIRYYRAEGEGRFRVRFCPSCDEVEDPGKEKALTDEDKKLLEQYNKAVDERADKIAEEDAQFMAELKARRSEL